MANQYTVARDSRRKEKINNSVNLITWNVLYMTWFAMGLISIVTTSYVLVSTLSIGIAIGMFCSILSLLVFWIEINKFCSTKINFYQGKVNKK